jgi:hypothetical protein
MKRMLVLTATVGMMLVALPAVADGGDKVDKIGAKEAYDRGTKAYARGDYAIAAKEFATADALAPSPTALQAALEASVEADAPAIGAELIERAKRETAPRPALAEAIAVAKKKFAGRGGFVHVVCPGTSCSGTLDGSSFDTTKPYWATTGAHTVGVEVDGKPRPAMKVTVVADQTVEVTPEKNSEEEPPAAPPPAPIEVSTSKKLPPFVFWIGAGATAVAGIATVAFGLGASGSHDDFVGAGCTDGTGSAGNCASLRDDGEGAVTRTNISLVSTLVLGAATAVVGFMFTQWTGEKPSQPPAPTAPPTARRTMPGWSMSF